MCLFVLALRGRRQQALWRRRVVRGKRTAGTREENLAVGKAQRPFQVCANQLIKGEKAPLPRPRKFLPMVPSFRASRRAGTQSALSKFGPRFQDMPIKIWTGIHYHLTELTTNVAGVFPAVFRCLIPFNGACASSDCTAAALQLLV